MANENELVKEFTDKKYEYGFTTDVHTEIIERGLNEEVIRLISEKKGEPDWLPLLAHARTARLGTRQLASNRLSSHILLCRPY